MQSIVKDWRLVLADYLVCNYQDNDVGTDRGLSCEGNLGSDRRPEFPYYEGVFLPDEGAAEQRLLHGILWRKDLDTS